jgi:hypothetical protein
MLGNSVATVVGVAAGMFLAFRSKKVNKNIWRPFVVCTGVGTFADFLYGYFGNCRQLRVDYQLMTRQQKELGK